MKKIALLFPLLLVACKVDHAEIEESIKKEFKSKNVEIKSVSCPDAKAGEKSECKATDANGTAFTVNVTPKSGGGIEWKFPGSTFDSAEMAKQLKEKGFEGADCGTGSYVLMKGVKYDCKAGGKTVTVNFTSDEGAWSAGPADGAKAEDKKEEKKDDTAEEKKGE